MATEPTLQWGALPARTVRPRDGELDVRHAGSQLFLPLLYLERDTEMPPGGGNLRCARCGSTSVHLAEIVEIRRKDYSIGAARVIHGVMDIAPDEAWPRGDWESHPIRDSSLLLEFWCEIQHSFVVEFGRHKALTKVAVMSTDNLR